MSSNDYTWPPYPEPPHIAHMRASIEAVRALCVTWRGKDGRVPCALIERVLPDEDES